MEDFVLLQFIAMGFASLIMLALIVFMVSFGKIIEETPDGKEKRGEKIRDEKSIESLASPKNASRLYAGGLIILFIIGITIVLLAGGSKILIIVGGVTMFAALLFSATIVLFELMIYNKMQGNERNMKMGVI